MCPRLEIGLTDADDERDCSCPRAVQVARTAGAVDVDKRLIAKLTVALAREMRRGPVPAGRFYVLAMAEGLPFDQADFALSYLQVGFLSLGDSWYALRGPRFEEIAGRMQAFLEAQHVGCDQFSS